MLSRSYINGSETEDVLVILRRMPPKCIPLLIDDTNVEMVNSYLVELTTSA